MISIDIILNMFLIFIIFVTLCYICKQPIYNICIYTFNFYFIFPLTIFERNISSYQNKNQKIKNNIFDLDYFIIFNI